MSAFPAVMPVMTVSHVTQADTDCHGRNVRGSNASPDPLKCTRFIKNISSSIQQSAVITIRDASDVAASGEGLGLSQYQSCITGDQMSRNIVAVFIARMVHCDLYSGPMTNERPAVTATDQ